MRKGYLNWKFNIVFGAKRFAIIEVINHQETGAYCDWAHNNNFQNFGPAAQNKSGCTKW